MIGFWRKREEMWYGNDCHDENYDYYHDRHENDDDFVELYNDYKQYKA